METRYEEEGLKERTREIEKSIIKRFRKEIWRPFVKALNEYEMIQELSLIHISEPTRPY